MFWILWPWSPCHSRAMSRNVVDRTLERPRAGQTHARTSKSHRPSVNLTPGKMSRSGSIWLPGSLKWPTSGVCDLVVEKMGKIFDRNFTSLYKTNDLKAHSHLKDIMAVWSARCMAYPINYPVNYDPISEHKHTE